LIELLLFLLEADHAREGINGASRALARF